MDGVIAKAPLGLDKLLKHRTREWNFLLSTLPGKFLYNNIRRIDYNTREILYRLQNSGHRIIVATYVFEKYRSLAEGWLKKNSIPFDKLILAKNDESASEFKVRAVLEEKCDYFVEDCFIFVGAISQKVSGVRVIHYVKKEDLHVLLLLRGEHSAEKEAPPPLFFILIIVKLIKYGYRN